MASTGFVFATSARSFSPGTGTAWTTPNNIFANDAVFATCALTLGSTSQWLMGYNFGITLPAGCTINGIQARMRWKGSGTGLLANCWLQFNAATYVVNGDGISSGFAAGSLTTTNADTTVGDTTGGYPTWLLYDSNSDGTGDRAFLNSDFSGASGFGVGFYVVNSTAGTKTASVDSISVNINYTAATTTVPNQLMMMGCGT